MEKKSKRLYKGILEITPAEYGFLRNEESNFKENKEDPYLSSDFLRENGLREGLEIEAEIIPSERPNRNFEVSKVLTCNGLPFEEYPRIANIKDGISIDPNERLRMTLSPKDLTGRMMDILTPIGKGQRGMIISPPKAGKKTLLKHIARAVHQNNPEVKIFILLVDERPEEVTDFQRDLEGVKVFHSSADQDVDQHLRITFLAMNRAIRCTEFGDDVLVLIDSLTRMGRAFNKDADSGSKTLSGGLAANALELPRRFFGAARKIEDGGSLTIMATILVETNSKMDTVIFHEFKGTGNLELTLCRECADQRMFPAINVIESGTRKEQILFSRRERKESQYLRRKTADLNTTDALNFVFKHFREKISEGK
ncbi:MAG: transcription termination factor Rho [Calditrichota bacterium]